MRARDTSTGASRACLASGSIPAALLTSGRWFLPKQSAEVSQSSPVARHRPAAHRRRDHFSHKLQQRFALASRRRCRAHAVRAPITVAVGALLGVLVTISSVGAGALGVAVLFYLYPRLPAIRIIGSDVAHAVPLTLVAGLGHWLIGSVDWSLLGSLLLGSLPGIWLGSHASAKVPDRILRPILAGMLVLIGGKLIAQ
jgi:uncharacterized membrane protein YfcA